MHIGLTFWVFTLGLIQGLLIVGWALGFSVYSGFFWSKSLKL